MIDWQSHETDNCLLLHVFLILFRFVTLSLLFAWARTKADEPFFLHAQITSFVAKRCAFFLRQFLESNLLKSGTNFECWQPGREHGRPTWFCCWPTDCSFGFWSSVPNCCSSILHVWPWLGAICAHAADPWLTKMLSPSLSQASPIFCLLVSALCWASGKNSSSAFCCSAADACAWPNALAKSFTLLSLAVALQCWSFLLQKQQLLLQQSPCGMTWIPGFVFLASLTTSMSIPVWASNWLWMSLVVSNNFTTRFPVQCGEVVKQWQHGKIIVREFCCHGFKADNVMNCAGKATDKHWSRIIGFFLQLVRIGLCNICIPFFTCPLSSGFDVLKCGGRVTKPGLLGSQHAKIQPKQWSPVAAKCHWTSVGTKPWDLLSVEGRDGVHVWCPRRMAWVAENFLNPC